MENRKLISGPHLWWTLFAMNMKAHFRNPIPLMWQSFGMIANNVIFFLIWVAFFRVNGEVNGWHLHDVTILFGFAAVAFGFAMFLMGGIRHLATMVDEGELDIWRSRPVDLLAPVLFHKSEPYSVGDILTGLAFVVVFGSGGWAEVSAILILGAFSGVTLVFLYLSVSCLSLWTRGNAGLIATIHEIVIITGSMPLHGLPMLAKVFLFTALPAGFISYLPAEIVRSPQLGEVFLYVVGSLLIWKTGAEIFKRGLRRYASSGA